jgi:zinc protease
MESERMLHPIIEQDGVDTQNEVVKEEKRFVLTISLTASF